MVKDRCNVTIKIVPPGPLKCPQVRTSERLLTGVYFSQSSIISFCWKFSRMLYVLSGNPGVIARCPQFESSFVYCKSHILTG